MPLDRGEPAKLAEVRLKAGEMLVTAAISDCGTFLAFTTTARLRLLRLTLEEGETPRLERVRLPDSPEDVHHLLLPAGRLMTISPHGLTVFSLTSAGAELDRTLSLTELGLEGVVSRWPALTPPW